jgi:pyridoxine 5-phosphate synthase
MTTLSVNVNKIATLRNARGRNLPNVLTTALDMIRFGAQGITVHPRPDARHIRHRDVHEIAANIDVELNIEGYPTEKFIELVQEVKPAQCTLVPDPPDVLTSNAGWDVIENQIFLTETVEKLHAADARVSIFFDPFDLQGREMEIIGSSIGADRIELYTEAYAQAYHGPERDEVTAVYTNAAKNAKLAGLEINAGHDLDLRNLNHLIKYIPFIAEVSIGHALICDALYLGLEETIHRYLQCLSGE